MLNLSSTSGDRVTTTAAHFRRLSNFAVSYGWSPYVESLEGMMTRMAGRHAMDMLGVAGQSRYVIPREIASECADALAAGRREDDLGDLADELVEAVERLMRAGPVVIELDGE